VVREYGNRGKYGYKSCASYSFIIATLIGPAFMRQIFYGFGLVKVYLSSIITVFSLDVFSETDGGYHVP